MKSPSIVLLVLDTLREDYAEELGRLEGMGFVRYDGVAPSSWTLPSHVSMFTGELPSTHGVRETFGLEWRDLMGVSKARMAKPTLLDTLKGRGYATYGFSANLFVTPQFGFAFGQYRLYDENGELKEPPASAASPGMMRRLVPLLYREGLLGGLFRWLVIGVAGTLLSYLGKSKLEKGSKHILESVKSTKFEGPFFAFVNLMEAHNPYVHWALDTLVVRLAILGLRPRAGWWRRMYPGHARLAVSRGVDAVSLFLPYDPLIIVVSDHGQLLGGRGRYGHGFSLDEELLKVPIYVRYPEGTRATEVAGPLVSLVEVRRIIEAAAGGEECRIGSPYAVAESWEEDNYTPRRRAKGEMHQIFSGKVGIGRARVFSRGGSVLVRRDTGAIEEATEGLSRPEAEELAKKVPAETSAPGTSPGGMTSKEEEAVLGRLKQLGYD